MSGCIDQCTLIVLAMDLDQSTANLLEHLHADRLIVDKSPCATIGQLHTAKDQFVLHGNIISRQKRAVPRFGSSRFCSKNIHAWTWARSIGSVGRNCVPSAR